MASLPPLGPDRDEPQSPPETPPEPDGPLEPTPEETAPLSPDIAEPGVTPEELPDEQN